MKKIVSVFILLAGMILPAAAQNPMNDDGDNIVGTYMGHQKDHGDFKVKIWKTTSGTYCAKLLWVEKDKDERGHKYTDVNNPDKTLRNTPCDQIVVFTGLKYDAEKKRWGDTKIYDPNRGMKANMVARFENDGRLSVTGSKLGFSQTVYWVRVNGEL